MFSITPRDSRGNVAQYQKLVIGQGSLKNITTEMTQPFFKGLGEVRWSTRDINYPDFDTLTNTLPVTYNPVTAVETIDLSDFNHFPTVYATKLYILEKGEVTSYASTEKLNITKNESLQYKYDTPVERSVSQNTLTLSTVGPKVVLYSVIKEVNGQPLHAKNIPQFQPTEEKDVNVLFEMSNQGTSIAENVVLYINSGPYFAPVREKLPPYCTVQGTTVEVTNAVLLPGETRRVQIHYRATDAACATVYDSSSVVHEMHATYTGTYSISGSMRKDVFIVPDYSIVELPGYDFQMKKLLSSHTSIRRGQTMTLSAECVNGAVAANNVSISFYAVINGTDTVLIGTEELKNVEKLSKRKLFADYIIPETAQYIEILAKVDPGNTVGEFCELNNVLSLHIPIAGLDWILDVENSPNPVRNETRISYVLTQDVVDMKLIIYTLDGREIGRVEDPPAATGRHSVVWQAPDIPNGMYMYMFESTVGRGQKQTHLQRFVKIK